MLDQLASIINGELRQITFTVVEIGALQIEGHQEPFYRLLDLFPGSQIIGFEVDEALCASMNSKAKHGVHYYPSALGERNERRPFHVTRHPMCSSLYEPNTELISLYNNFEVAYPERVIEIDTVSLDCFSRVNHIDNIDFIKIDVQGAELDVFRGGVSALENVLALVAEVEFIPHYLGQPLFGDVCSFLSENGMMFHKFLGLAGRALRPVVINSDPNIPSQHIWSDAMYIRHVQAIKDLDPSRLLKLSALAAVYGSPDLVYFCLATYDEIRQTSLAMQFLLACGD